jgi:RNAse (barnase) inhibitor barstar
MTRKDELDIIISKLKKDLTVSAKHLEENYDYTGDKFKRVEELFNNLKDALSERKGIK